MDRDPPVAHVLFQVGSYWVMASAATTSHDPAALAVQAAEAQYPRLS